MMLSVAVWLVIAAALVMANLPFVLDRPIAAWGWAESQGSNSGERWLRCVGFLVGLGLWSWGTLLLLGGAFAGGGDTAGLFFVKLLVSGLVAAAWLYWPGWHRAVPQVKPFIDRFLELLVGYVLVGTLGNALELNLGNAFTQGWEFYAVTLALFLVLAYPGFVWRYMMRRRRGH